MKNNLQYYGWGVMDVYGGAVQSNDSTGRKYVYRSDRASADALAAQLNKDGDEHYVPGYGPYCAVKLYYEPPEW